MMTCSSFYAPFRWILREPTWGHVPMHPARDGKYKLTITCAECLKTWEVVPTFPPSRTFAYGLWLAKAKHLKNIVRWRKAA